MLNLGLDFGSTTSILSVYEKQGGGLQTINLDSGIPYVPSRISHSLDDRSVHFGVEVKSDIEDEEKKVYEAFKTLLNSSPDSDIVKQKGYDSKNTPTTISKEFLNLLLNKVMKDRNASQIDNLVVGVPENWGRSVQTSSHSQNTAIRQSMGTRRLAQILKNLSYVKHFKIVFEPEAASAFFAYNYNRIHQTELNGKVLIIDYGGGSLDITLSEVRTGQDGKMEVRLLDSDGLGENQEEANGMVGSAGILYIESLLKCALEEAGIEFDFTNPQNKREFDRLRADVEIRLRDNKNKIKEAFESMPIDDTTLTFFNEKALMKRITLYVDDTTSRTFNITYGQLYRVYHQVIQPELEGIIDAVLKRNPSLNISKKNFKIGLVGGFSNFYFVRKQIWDKFRISSANDQLVDGLLTNPEEQEKAISLGAALIANGIIDLCVTSEFGIGVFTYQRINDKLIAVPHFAIQYRQELEYNRFYYSYVSAGNGAHQKQLIGSATGTIRELIIHRDKDIRHIMTLIPRLDEEAANALRHVIDYQANIAFAISEDGTISIRFDEVEDRGGGKFEVIDTKTVKLTKFDEMFNNYTVNDRGIYEFDDWVRLVESGVCDAEG